MHSIDDFHEGDEVVFVLDKKAILTADRYIVIRKSENNITVAQKGDERIVSPVDLLTPSEIDVFKKEANSANLKLYEGWAAQQNRYPHFSV